MLQQNNYLIVATIIFILGFSGIFINRKNLITLLLSIELILLAVNINFVTFARFNGNITGEIFVFFILTIAAAEAAIGLAILIILFRKYKTISVQEITKLQG